MKNYFVQVIGRKIATKMKNRNKNYFKLLLSLSFLSIFFVSYQPPFKLNTNPTSTRLSVINSMKTVLLTSPAYWGMKFEMGRLGFINAGCEVSNCVLTTNISYVNDYNFDAFMIHAPSQWGGRWPLPGKRRRDQIFIFFSTEPPGNKYLSYKVKEFL